MVVSALAPRSWMIEAIWNNPDNLQLLIPRLWRHGALFGRRPSHGREASKVAPSMGAGTPGREVRNLERWRWGPAFPMNAVGPDRT